MVNKQITTASGGKLPRKQKAATIQPLLVHLGELWEKYFLMQTECPDAVDLIEPDPWVTTFFLSEAMAIRWRFLMQANLDEKLEARFLQKVGPAGAEYMSTSKQLCVHRRSEYHPGLVEVSVPGENERYWIFISDEEVQVQPLPSDVRIIAEIICTWNDEPDFTSPPLSIGDDQTVSTVAFGVNDIGMWPSTNGYHPGLDLFAPTGTPVLAVADGTVIGYYDGANGTYIGKNGYNGTYIKGMSPTDEGNNRDYIVIQHGTVFTVYAHLAPGSTRVGDLVFAGQQIGTLGQHANGPHLHLETRTFGQATHELEQDGRPADTDRPLVFVDPAIALDGAIGENIKVTPNEQGVEAFTGGRPAGIGQAYPGRYPGMEYLDIDNLPESVKLLISDCESL